MTVWLWQEGRMEKIWKRIHTIIPEYRMIPLIFAVVFNLADYCGYRMIDG